ncbi:DUF4303 domain-containing protein [Paenibacillus paeoniae]|uniref:DUF4303 domain-containing protein n=1 Tax=Paenibacillus paeoniae TaxID=2292705 RepID=A0A371PGJ9_9BACL|nr:DUF4303 domain-containing protein [Paenibacillus paeoniae]REK75067.1 DUF4303 domain-containing protein [Paenibacillus paeoniae]
MSNYYYSMIGRLLDGRTPVASTGYYMLDEDGQVSYSTIRPSVEVTTLESFTDALVEECKRIIQEFADSADNKEVYAFNLYTDEHRGLYVYMNTESCFKETLSSYQNEKEDEYDRDRTIQLKYNSGDFDFQFWFDTASESGRHIDHFVKVHSAVSYESKETIEEAVIGVPVAAIESGVIDDGYYVCVLNTVKRLIADQAFGLLNTTSDFIAFAACGDDYVDYSITMRKTIDEDLFYQVFPDVKELDSKFEEVMKGNENLSLAESIAYWSDGILRESLGSEPYSFQKPFMEIFVQLSRFGNELAQESIERLTEIAADLQGFDGEVREKMSFYLEALHFSGKLTPEQAEQCDAIADRLEDADEAFRDEANMLRTFVS